jgi:transcriptional regulator with XRE-family HTH domain
MGGRELRSLLGQNLKALRNRRNWSQADLSEYADISINFLGDIERGKKWPHPDTLSRLAEALGIKAFELFRDEEPIPGPDSKVLMDRFVQDVTLTISKSLSLSVSQSVDHIRKQYNLG